MTTICRSSRDTWATGGGGKLSTEFEVIPTDFTDRSADFADTTRGYPTDFTDESNRLNLISFRIAYVGKVRVATQGRSRS
jgi:hypothetical protein